MDEIEDDEEARLASELMDEMVPTRPCVRSISTNGLEEMELVVASEAWRLTRPLMMEGTARGGWPATGLRGGVDGGAESTRSSSIDSLRRETHLVSDGAPPGVGVVDRGEPMSPEPSLDFCRPIRPSMIFEPWWTRFFRLAACSTSSCSVKSSSESSGSRGGGAAVTDERRLFGLVGDERRDSACDTASSGCRKTEGMLREIEGLREEARSSLGEMKRSCRGVTLRRAGSEADGEAISFLKACAPRAVAIVVDQHSAAHGTERAH